MKILDWLRAIFTFFVVDVPSKLNVLVNSQSNLGCIANIVWFILCLFITITSVKIVNAFWDYSDLNFGVVLGLAVIGLLIFEFIYFSGLYIIGIFAALVGILRGH